MDITKCRIVDLEEHKSNAGRLVVMEKLPFEIKRIFYIIFMGTYSGGHAHKKCEQILIPVRGAFTVTVTNGYEFMTYRLGDPTKGLYIPAMIWAIEDYFENGTIMVVACSHEFEERDYIRNFEEYI